MNIKIISLIQKKNESKNEDEDNNFRILFRTENMNKPFIYSQFNPILKETAYSINYTYTLIFILLTNITHILSLSKI